MKKIWCTFGKTGGKSKRQIDKELRKRAMQFQISAPADYEERLDKLLAELPMDEPQPQPVVPTKRERHQRNRYIMVMKPVFAAFAIIIFGSTVLVGNSVSYLDNRMDEMPDTEIKEYNEITHKSEADADTYTREFTAEERNRMDQLKLKYVSEGGYPVGDLRLLNTVSEWDGKTPAFAVLTSTFCVPDRELRDEELLEFMEFIYKREHSVEKTNAEEAESAVDVTNEVDEAVLKKAVTFVKETLGMDVSENEYKVQCIGMDTEYLITYKEQNQDVCQVVLNTETGDVIEVSDVSLRAYGEMEFEESYIDEGLRQVLECVSSDEWRKSEVEHVTAEYCLYENNGVMRDGNIRYLVELKDGSSYSCSYSCEKQNLMGIRYMEERPSLEEWYSVTDSICEQHHLIREVRSIQ